MVIPYRESVPDWLFRLLQQVQGLRIHSEPGSSFISVSANAGIPTIFEVASVPVLSQEQAEELIQAWHNFGADETQHHRLIATRHLAGATRDLLRREGVSWAEELTGTCRLSGPGLLVDLKIRDAAQKEVADSIRARFRERSGVVAETLLLAFRHEDIRLANLAKQSNVSTALASRVLARIANLKLIETHGAGPNRFWRIANLGGILDLWATEEHQVMQATSLYVWSRSPQELFRKLTLLNQLNGRWALASTAAANMYAPTLTTYPDPTIWIDSRIPFPEVASILGGEVAEKGPNLHIWQSKNNLAFEKATVWKPESRATDMDMPELRIVSRPRAYIETVNGPGRSPEVAQSLRQRILANA